MRKKLIGTLLLLSMVICLTALMPVCANAESGTIGENLTYVIDDDGTLTISGTGEVKYEDFWYSGISGEFVEKVVIENGVEMIGDQAFWDFYNIKSISIPNTMTMIGRTAFANCISLTSINIPDSVITIGDLAFSGCTSLSSVTLGKGLTAISLATFKDCSNLRSIDIPNNVKLIDGNAFEGCLSLTDVMIGDGVSYIETAAFGSCISLKNISVSADNDYFCTINGSLFSKDKKTLVAYAHGRTETTYTIPSHVTKIGNGAFYGNSSLSKINILENVTDIGYFAFAYCSGVKSFNVSESNKNYSSTDGNLFSKDNTTIVVYAQKKDESSYTIPDCVTLIERCAFAGAENLINVNMGRDVKIISIGAFSACINLCEIIIPNSVTEICDSAFLGCIGAKKLIIGDNVKSIGDSAFFRCESISNIVLGKSVKSIGDTAFYECMNLRDIVLGENIETIGNGTFGFSGLECINIPDNVIAVDEWAFEWCENLKEVRIGRGVKEISSNAFMGCYNLENVYYAGSEEEWNEIYIDDGNWDLLEANIYFNQDNTVVRKCSIVSAKRASGKINVTVENENVSGYIMLALYDNSGALLKVSKQPLTSSDSYSFPVSGSYQTAKARVFIWSDLAKAEALCEAYEVA